VRGDQWPLVCIVNRSLYIRARLFPLVILHHVPPRSHLIPSLQSGICASSAQAPGYPGAG
jgi:hypothetical protein